MAQMYVRVYVRMYAMIHFENKDDYKFKFKLLFNVA